MQFGPRYPARLLDVIERLSSERLPIAEINRRVGEEAERLGLPRPSYERVRELVHEARDLRGGSTSTTKIFVDVATRARSPRAYEDLIGRPPRPRLRHKLDK
jgi:hypothetical protein